jgi:hypothetical protein
VARNAGARFGCAFHNTIVLHVRHRLLRGQQRRTNNAACPAAVPQAASSTSANVERRMSMPAALRCSFFLGIFPQMGTLN